MSRDDDFTDLHDLFSAFGPIAVRRMFGGAGLFLDGLMFGLVHDGVIYLKVDETTSPAFEREGLKPFSYATKDGERVIASYRRMPDRLYDDTEELARWAAEAAAVAGRKSVKRARTKSRKKPSPRKRSRR